MSGSESKIIKISDDFWNIRGTFKLGYVADIGTHASLVRLRNGKFVFLDSYSFPPEVKLALDALTNDGKDVDAILNLHPFHTVHVKRMHEMYPDAKLYGTSRHLSKFPELPWQASVTEGLELHEKFKDDFEFSVPEGVDFVSSNENIHFSSVLALHINSKTIHSDDTFMYIRPPVLKKWFELPAALSFHPTLAKALQPRKGAADEFRHWATTLIERWGYAQNLCAAHTASLLHRNNKGATIEVRMKKALRNVKLVLALHEKWYG